MSHSIMNYSQIAPWLYLGTNLCCSMHAEKLEAIGAEIDISLEEERIELPGKMQMFVWLPVADHAAPAKEQLSIGTAVLREAEEKGIRAYVHCRNGHGRSPTLVIAYFISKGMPYDEAYALVAEKRPEIELTEVQRQALCEFEKTARV